MRKNIFKRKKSGIRKRSYEIVLSGLLVVVVAACSLYYGGKMLVKALDVEEASEHSSNADQTTKELDGMVKAPEETPANELKKEGRTTIVIDAGHGGIDYGGEIAGIMEKDINLSIAIKLEKMLKEMNYHVVMTRGDDSFPSKEERVEMANNLNADAFISIHQNTYETSDVHGIETWYDDSDEEVDNYNLAKFIHTKTLEKTGAKDRNLKQDAELYVTRETNMPSCLIETGFITSNSELDMLKNPKYQNKIAKGIAEGVDSFFHPKTMYLTFDDGPSDKNTNDILRILKERNIKATFFLIGENVKKNPLLARKIVEEGHTIGLHSYTHDYKKIYASKESFFDDFDKAYQEIVDVTGVKPRLFRFPGGSVNAFNQSVRKRIIKELDKRGIVYFDWNASLEDATKNPVPKTLLKNAKESSAGKDNVVLLAHETIAVTANILNDMIDMFSNYYMKPLTPKTKPIQFHTK